MLSFPAKNHKKMIFELAGCTEKTNLGVLKKQTRVTANQHIFKSLALWENFRVFIQEDFHV